MGRFLAIFTIIIILLSVFHGTSYCNNAQNILFDESIELYKAGRYPEAIKKGQKALNILENSFGPQHPVVSPTLDVLARIYLESGDYAKAKQLSIRSLAIQEKTGPDSQGITTSLILLSEVYIATWEMSKAEPLLQRALKITEKNLGSQHRDTAIILNDLGILYSHLEHYDKAEAAFQRALFINEKLGTDQVEISTNLQNLGHVYCSLGTPEKAEPLMQRALLIRKKEFGPEHHHVAVTLDSLARIYFWEGNYAKALQLTQRAVSIAENKLGPRHPVLAKYLGNLAEEYICLGDYDNAETSSLRALKISEQTLGPDHPDVAASRASLAMIYRKRGEMAKAESLYRQALPVFEKTMGTNHPMVAVILRNMAFPLVAQDKMDQALRNMQRALLIENDLLDQVMGFTSETQKLAFLTELQNNLDFFFSLVLFQEQANSKARNNAFSVWLKRKGAALEAQRQFRQALIQSGNPQGKALFERLAQLCAEFTRLTFMGQGQDSANGHQARLVELKKKQSDIEAELAKCSQNYARDRKRGQLDVATVARALPGGSVLVDFAKLDLFNFNAKGPQKKWRAQHYIAFVLPASSPDRLILIDLGEAEPIEQAVASLRDALQSMLNPSAIAKPARTLHDLVFAPLEAGIGNAKNVFISPDGVLNLIPFEILQNMHNRPLIETYTFNYVCSGRDLVGMGEIPTATGPSLVLGDPDFNMDARSTNAAPSHRAGASQPVRVFQRSADLRAMTLSPLPATRAEAEAVAKKIGGNARLRLGSEAAEGELEKGPAPRYLHLATHGFFLSDQEMQDTVNSRGLEERSYFSSNSRSGSGPAQHYENPLVRSAVALAGANVTLKGKGVNGIVTAEKFLTLPISGTEIVVLSACQTGLGDVKTGEGVFGLRRAITQAGAKGMVMSMWSVPDHETKELMEFFYDNLAKGMPKAQALRQAALQERDITIKRFNVDNPVYWGAFIYIGDK